MRGRSEAEEFMGREQWGVVKYKVEMSGLIICK